ncbi:MAG TPA: hypothetical protein VEA78_09695, partial [Acidimicrobiales bacterium]|nr:hypothetical protein [Acidimicrobiales bacterium]
MRRSLIAAIGATSLLLAACGGGGDDGADDVATLTEGERYATTTSTTIDPEQAMLAFAECMRDNGVDFPDPGADGRHEISVEAAEEDEWQAAQEACEAHRPRMAPVSEEDRAEIEEQARAMAECMRDRGWNMPDPVVRTPGDGGVQVMQGAPDDIDFEDPDFQADHEACGEELGFEGGP